MASEANILVEALVLLGGAVIAAPLFKRLGLGTVLGYLAAGIVIGPVLKFINDGEEILHFAELGVVLLLFVIGLELKPSRLWEMRRDIFGLGMTQVVASGLILSAIILGFGLSLGAATIVGFGLALSSTAFALQLLEDRREAASTYGQKSFSILLFQDLAIVPLLALVPLLAPGTADNPSPGWQLLLIAFACIAGLVLAGRFLLNPIFAIIAETGAREAMIAAALLVVIGSGLLLEYAGLSMAMGAFLAGVLLAESSYRHELEADIEPFRGILLGLFFMAVGMSLNLEVLREHWLIIVIAVPVALALKAVIIYACARLFGNSHNNAIQMAALLPQHGEFGFVLFASAAAASLIDNTMQSILISMVTLSMALTPLTVALGQRLLRNAATEEMDEDFEGAGGTRVLMVGFSRMGQIVAQTLLASGTDVTIIDNNPDRIRLASRFGFRIYFGDGTRKDVLIAAGIKTTSVVAVCTAQQEVTNHIVDLVKMDFPESRIFARAYDREHALHLLNEKVDYQIRETFESALEFGHHLLEELGIEDHNAEQIIADVRRRDAKRLAMQFEEGINAGRDMLHTKAVTPEPLIEPKRQARGVDEASQALVDSVDDTDIEVSTPTEKTN